MQFWTAERHQGRCTYYVKPATEPAMATTVGVPGARTYYQVLQVPCDVPVWASLGPQMERWRRAYVSHAVHPLPRPR